MERELESLAGEFERRVGEFGRRVGESGRRIGEFGVSVREFERKVGELGRSLQHSNIGICMCVCVLSPDMMIYTYVYLSAMYSQNTPIICIYMLVYAR